MSEPLALASGDVVDPPPTSTSASISDLPLPTVAQGSCAVSGSKGMDLEVSSVGPGPDPSHQHSRLCQLKLRKIPQQHKNIPISLAPFCKNNCAIDSQPLVK